MNNNTFQLFISSTFEDFARERDIINTDVYFAVNHMCEEKGYHFEIVDLRWGIREEAAYNQKTMPICLDEIRKCQKGPRPSCLILVGNRYGWVPLPYTIDCAQVDKMLAVMKTEERALFCSWYLKDENSLESRFVLRQRTGIFRESEKWSPVEKELLDILQRASMQVLPREEAERLCFLSATEQEIHTGFLDTEAEDKSAVIVFRDTPGEALLPEISRVRAKLTGKMKKCNNQNQILQFTDDEEYLNQFRMQIIEQLKTIIEQEIIRMDSAKEAVSFTQKALDFSSAYTEFFYGRHEQLAELKEYMASKDARVLFIKGDSGSGKTALLCRLYSEADPSYCYAKFWGSDEDSSDLLPVLNDFTAEIQKIHNLKQYMFQYHNTGEQFKKFLSDLSHETGDHTVVFLIDALDRYTDWDLFHENILDIELPENIKIIVSITPEAAGKVCRKSHCIMELNGFSAQESRILLEQYMKKKGRILCPEHRQVIEPLIENGCLPIQLRLLSQICCQYHSFENLEIRENNVYYLVNILFKTMSDISGHSRSLVSLAMELLALAPDGLTVRELREILMTSDRVVEDCMDREEQYRLLPEHEKAQLPLVYWSRLAYDLGDCIHIVQSHGYQTLQFSHGIYASAIKLDIKKEKEWYCDNDHETALEKLLTYFEDMNLWTDSGSANARKAFSLIPLRRNNNRIITDLISDVDFVHCLVETGQLDFVTALWNLQKETISDRRILTCLLDSRTALSGYPNTFRFCYDTMFPDQDNSKHAFSRLHRSEGKAEEYIPFQYSATSRCIFNPSSTYYVILQDDEIYLWSVDTFRETARGHVKKADICYWYSDEEFVIITETYEILNYRIVEQQPQLESRCSFYEKTIKGSVLNSFHMDPESRVLVLTYKNPQVGNFLFTVVEACIDSGMEDGISVKKEYMFLKNCYGAVWLPDRQKTAIVSRSGKRIKQKGQRFFFPAGLNNKISVDQTVFLENDRILLLFSNDVWINKGMLCACALAESNGKCRYLCPPDIHELMGILPGKKYLLFLYSRFVLLMDTGVLMFTGILRLDYYDRIVWSVEDSSIAVIQGQTMHIQFLNQIEPMEEPVFSTFQFSDVYGISREKQNTQIISQTKNLIKAPGRFMEYSLLSEYSENLSSVSETDVKKKNRVTMMAFSEDGKYAAAFELLDQVLIYEQNGSILCRITGMHFTLEQSLLNICFSPLGDYILMEYSNRMELIDIVENRKVWDCRIPRRKCARARFLKEGQKQSLHVSMDNRIIIVTMEKGKVTHKKHTIQNERKVFGAEEALLMRFGWRYSGISRFEVPLLTQPDKLVHAGARENLFAGDRYYYSDRDGSCFCFGRNGILFYVTSDQNNDLKELKYGILLAGADINLLENYLMLQEELLETFWREKNDRNGSFRIFGQYGILVIPGLNSVLAINLEKKELKAAYYHKEGITGARIMDNGSVLLGDRNGSVTLLNQNMWSAGEIEKSSYIRVQRNFLQKHQQAVTVTAALCGLTLFFTAGYRIFLKEQTIYADLASENILEAGAFYPLVMYYNEQSQSWIDEYMTDVNELEGIIYQGEDDYDHNGTQNLFVVRLEDSDDVQRKIMTGSMYEQEDEGRWKLQDTVELMNCDMAYYTALGDIFSFSRDGEWILCANHYRQTHRDEIDIDNHGNSVSFWTFQEDRFREGGSASWTDGESANEMRSVMVQEGLNDSVLSMQYGVNMAAELNDDVTLLCSIRQETAPVEMIYECMEADMDEISYGKVTIYAGNRRKNAVKQEKEESQEFQYLDFDLGISFIVDGFFEKSNLYHDSNGGISGYGTDDGIFAGTGTELILSKRGWHYTSGPEEKLTEMTDLFREELGKYQDKPVSIQFGQNGFELVYRNSWDLYKRYIRVWTYDYSCFRLEFSYPEDRQQEADIFLGKFFDSFTVNVGENTVKIDSDFRAELGDYDGTEEYVENVYRYFLAEELKQLTGCNTESVSYSIIKTQESEMPVLLVKGEDNTVGLFELNENAGQLSCRYWKYYDLFEQYSDLQYSKNENCFVIENVFSGGHNTSYGYYDLLTGNCKKIVGAIDYSGWYLDQNNEWQYAEADKSYYYQSDESDSQRERISEAVYMDCMDDLSEIEWNPLPDQYDASFADKNDAELVITDVVHQLQVTIPGDWYYTDSCVEGVSGHILMDNFPDGYAGDFQFRYWPGHTAEKDSLSAEIEQFSSFWRPVSSRKLDGGFEIVWRPDQVPESYHYTYYERV